MRLYSEVIRHYCGNLSNYAPTANYINGLCSGELKKKSDVNMLDLGSGTGEQAKVLAQWHKITAVDNSPHMVELFKRTLQSEISMGRVRLLEEDWFDPKASWRSCSEGFELVYSLGNTVSLTGSYEKLRELFILVHFVLVHGGLFVFDYFSFDDLTHGAELKWGDVYKTNDDNVSFQKAMSQITHPENRTRDLTLHVRWNRGGVIKNEIESYLLYLMNHSEVLKLSNDLGFTVVRYYDQDNDRDPDENSKAILWALKKV